MPIPARGTGRRDVAFQPWMPRHDKSHAGESILLMALYASGFANDLRCRQCPTAAHGEQRSRQWCDQQLDLGLEVVDMGSDFVAASNEIAGQGEPLDPAPCRAGVDGIAMLQMPQARAGGSHEGLISWRFHRSRVRLCIRHSSQQ